MARHDRLTVKQQRFVDAYEGNATEAARKAGYKGNAATLGAVGNENLKKPAIADAIRAREAKRASSTIANRAERQAFWTAMMRDTGASESDRLRASELLGKSEGDFLQRVEHSGDIGMYRTLSDADLKALAAKVAGS